MNAAFLLLFATAVCTFSSDLVLDNFDDHNDQNALHHFWYYYSDVNDSGTTQIHNAVADGNGAYTNVVPVKRDGSTTDYCALVDFTLGDSLPLEMGVDSRSGFDGFVPFAGIGTDIGEEGIEPVNIFGFDSVSFDIHVSDTFRIFFEIVNPDFSGKEQNAFFESQFRCFPGWQKIVVRKSEIESPGWFYEEHAMSDTTYFQSVTKFNWRITHESCKSTKCKRKITGQVQLDNIVIHGAEKTAAFKTAISTHRSHRFYQQATSEPEHRYFTISGKKVVGNRCSSASSAAGLVIEQSGVSSRPVLRSFLSTEK